MEKVYILFDSFEYEDDTILYIGNDEKHCQDFLTEYRAKGKRVWGTPRIKWFEINKEVK